MDMKLTISAVGADMAAQKKLLTLIDGILFNHGKDIPEGITREFKNIRTRVRKPRTPPTLDPILEAAVIAGD